MSIPELKTVPFYNIPRDQIGTDEICPNCLDGTHNDSGLLWVGHKDVSNPDEKKREKLIHLIHTDCVKEMFGKNNQCPHRDVHLDLDSLAKCAHISDDVKQAIKEEKKNDSTRESVVEWGRIGALIGIAASIAMVVPAIIFGIVPLIIASAILGGVGLLCGIALQLTKTFFPTIDYDLLRSNQDKFIYYIESSPVRYDRLQSEGICGLANEFASTLKA